MRVQLIVPASILLLGSLANGTPIEERGAKICDPADPCNRLVNYYKGIAVPFCSSFLGVPKATVTVTAKATGPAIIATVTTTVQATVTTVIQATVTTTTTAPATTTVVPAKRALPECGEDAVFGHPCARAVKRNAKPSCPPWLSAFAESRISSACSCLSIPKATTTITAIAAPTTTTTTAAITTTATVSTTSTVTTIVTVIATPAPKGICDISYNASGNGSGNAVTFIAATSQADCCQKCQATPNCVANAYVAGQCQLLVSNTDAGGGGSSICPLGIKSYAFGSPVAGGVVYAGPCAAL